jgi:hypothetical protein
MSTIYDKIGGTYSDNRRSDPRIAAAVDKALDGCSTILNVGAGTGSYEPESKMTAAQMLGHCSLSMQWALGEVAPEKGALPARLMGRW